MLIRVHPLQRDFTPKELAVLRITKEDKQPKRIEPKAKFQDMTMNKAFFKDWGANRRPRYGDFHEGYKEIVLVPKVRDQVIFRYTFQIV